MQVGHKWGTSGAKVGHMWGTCGAHVGQVEQVEQVEQKRGKSGANALAGQMRGKCGRSGHMQVRHAEQILLLRGNSQRHLQPKAFGLLGQLWQRAEVFPCIHVAFAAVLLEPVTEASIAQSI